MTNKRAIEEKIFQSLGAASMCWDSTPTGTFESNEATKIGESLMNAVREHVTDVILFLAQNHESLKTLTPYEIYDLFMQKEIDNVGA